MNLLWLPVCADGRIIKQSCLKINSSLLRGILGDEFIIFYVTQLEDRTARRHLQSIPSWPINKSFWINNLL